jgi:hypothetical protein
VWMRYGCGIGVGCDVDVDVVGMRYGWNRFG